MSGWFFERVTTLEGFAGGTNAARTDHGLPLARQEVEALEARRHAKYGVTKFWAPGGYNKLVSEVPAHVLPEDVPANRRGALGQLIIEGVRLGIGLRQSGQELTQLSRAKLTTQLMQQMFELGFRTYDTDEANLVATGIELGDQWDATGIFPVPLSRMNGLDGTDPSGHEELQARYV